MPLMLYADVDGSLEALTSSLLAVNTGRIVYKVVTATVGPPSSRDVQMAFDTGACIVCFGFSMPGSVQRETATRGVDTVQSECDSCSHVLNPLAMLLTRLPRESMGLRVTVSVCAVSSTSCSTRCPRGLWRLHPKWRSGCPQVNWRWLQHSMLLSKSRFQQQAR